MNAISRMLMRPLIGSCHDVGERLSAELEGELGGVRRWRLRLHLAVCDGCRAVYRSLGRVVAGLRLLGTAELAPAPSVAESVVERIQRDPH